MPSTNIDDHRASQLTRRKFLGSAAVLGAASLAPARLAHREATATTPDVTPFELDETTVVALQDGMKSGQFTAALDRAEIS